MGDWVRKKKAQDALTDAFNAAYSAQGLDRADWFLRLSLISAWHGLISPWGAIKLLVAGGVLGRSVTFNQWRG